MREFCLLFLKSLSEILKERKIVESVQKPGKPTDN